VPWFVAWFDGKPEFRAMDGLKWIRAVREHLCWVCGGRLGVWQTFVLGPMCGINRTTVEPPCHLECAPLVGAQLSVPGAAAHGPAGGRSSGGPGGGRDLYPA
jgi:hypothetical protein